MSSITRRRFQDWSLSSQGEQREHEPDPDSEIRAPIHFKQGARVSQGRDHSAVQVHHIQCRTRKQSRSGGKCLSGSGRSKTKGIVGEPLHKGSIYLR